jgi:hypothetical protein
MMQGTHNFLAADNLPFDGIGTDLGQAATSATGRRLLAGAPGGFPHR